MNRVINVGEKFPILVFRPRVSMEKGKEFLGNQ